MPVKINEFLLYIASKICFIIEMINRIINGNLIGLASLLPALARENPGDPRATGGMSVLPIC